MDKFQFSQDIIYLIERVEGRGGGLFLRAKDKVSFEDTHRWSGSEMRARILARCGWPNGLEHPLLFSRSETTIRIRRSGLLPLSSVLLCLHLSVQPFGSATLIIFFATENTRVFPFNSYSLSYFDTYAVRVCKLWGLCVPRTREIALSRPRQGSPRRATPLRKPISFDHRTYLPSNLRSRQYDIEILQKSGNYLTSGSQPVDSKELQDIS